MATRRFQSFEEFWPFYLKEHSKRATRTWHFVGTTIGLLFSISVLLAGSPALVPLGLLPGYASSWFSHFFIEKNRPASWTYPLWSFMGDWKMWGFIVSGRIDSEVTRLGV